MVKGIYILLLMMCFFVVSLYSAQPTSKTFVQGWGWDPVNSRYVCPKVGLTGEAAITGALSTVLSGEVEVTQPTHDDLNANVNLQVGDADVDAANPVPISGALSTVLSGEVEVTQPIHDDLNGNSNIQINDVDVGSSNEVPVKNGNTKLTAEVYNNGTFAVQAASTVADGADVTQGTTTDARSTATDATSVTIMQVLKEISYMEQNPASRAVTGTFWQATQPVSAASLPLPSGAATSALQLADGHNVTVDNAGVGSAVNIQDGGNSITVDGTFWQATQPVSGTVTADLSATDNAVLDQIELNTDFGIVNGGGVETSALRVTLASDSTGLISVDDNGSSLTVDGTFWQATQPVSAVDLDIRDLTATDVVTTNLSATDNAVLDQIELNTDYGIVVGGGVEATALRVTLASDSTGVVSVDDGGGTITVDGSVTASATDLDIRALASGTDSVSAVQSGTWNIGSITTLPSIPAGTNNIGDVDVVTMPNVSTAVPTLYQVVCTSADTEYSQAFSSAKSIVFQNQGNDIIRYAFVTGKVAGETAPYMTLKAGGVFNKDNLNIASGTLYFASPVAGQTVEMEVW